MTLPAYHQPAGQSDSDEWATPIGAWMKKAWDESRYGALVVCLVPSRTGTAWFHDYAVRGRLEFLRGRLKFGGAGFAPFESLVVTFFPGDERIRLFSWDAA